MCKNASVNDPSIATESKSHQPTVSIYQNAEHVGGILQQIFGEPLISSESREVATGQAQNSGSVRKGQASLSAKATVPIVGAVGANLGGDRTGSNSDSSSASQKSQQNFVYSQAYYLYVIRNWLRDEGKLKRVESVKDALALLPGQFVEYQATFKANELNAILDILTPDLVAAITDHQVKSSGFKVFPQYGDFDSLQRFSYELMERSKAHAELARAIAEAVRVDFRSEKTREYYGKIGLASSAVTAVTICDTRHFVVEDEDRILDGLFTVLGKVTSSGEVDVPVLKRNKVLDRIKPEAVDWLFDVARRSVSEQANKLDGSQLSALADAETPSVSDVFDAAFSSRIEGTSFRVVPIAIYI